MPKGSVRLVLSITPQQLERFRRVAVARYAKNVQAWAISVLTAEVRSAEILEQTPPGRTPKPKGPARVRR